LLRIKLKCRIKKSNPNGDCKHFSEKVYCKDCKHWSGILNNMGNSTCWKGSYYEETYYGKRRVGRPAVCYNVNNDCKDFEAKFTETFDKGQTRIEGRYGGRSVHIQIPFSDKASAVTPGQSAVFYEGDDVVGGGIILTDTR